ncbi:MAG: DUF1800 family protein [Saprospiraceae bacterium]|nr:DUF1800 family protein [Saprospiraceae bacterium]MBK8451343.1 DUF1800 family protein [Saprospiraceae bacterium]MBK9722343.1 DUF1800 family protein [Saprospiraceae bacterium]
MGSLKPYSGSFGKPELLHLLRRTLFGVSKPDLNYFKNKSLNEVLDILIPATPKLPDPPVRAYYNNIDPTKDTLDKINNNGVIETVVKWGDTWIAKPVQTNFLASSNNNRRNSLKQWWTGLQIHQSQNVYEKMVLFYQNLLVTEDAVIENANTMYNTQSLYRKHAFGNYKQLIKDITFDAGMLRYLNGERNTKKAPDENFGRELQELFCVGKGPGSAYTEDDVKAAARVMTGWYVIYREKVNGVDTNVISRPAFNKANHDIDVKTFSAFYGNTSIAPDMTITDPSPFLTIDEKRAFVEVDTMIEMIFATEEVSKYICRRLWNYFVYYEITPEIESEVIEPLSAIFRQYINDKDQMKYVIRAMFNSDFFFKIEHRGCMIKSPIDFNVGMVRQFEFPLPNASQLEAQYYMWNIIRTYCFNAGQDINDPPNVAGWPAYYQTPSFHEIWVDTATYPVRQGSYTAIAKSNFALNKNNTYDGANSPSYGFITKINFIEFVKKFENPSDPNALIAEATELMLGAPVSQAVKDALKTNYLLLGQSTDYYWTDAWEVYLLNPGTSDPEAKRVPAMLTDLFTYLLSSAEYHLC